VGGLLELVAEDGAFFVLGLPADETRPGAEEGLVDDFDAVGAVAGSPDGEILRAILIDAALRPYGVTDSRS
jgi:hypothetical protein